MAAITKVDPVLCSPVGYENVQHGYAGDTFAAGDLVIISGTPPSTRWDCAFEDATAAVAHGIVLKDVTEGGTAEVAFRGEMDGYSGLTPGAALSVATGVIDDTAPAATQVGAAVIRAVSATRIRFDLT
jgi:hypothetical protein